MTNDIRNSILGLAQNHNGEFKTEKQANFLIGYIESHDGHIGHTSAGTPYFAECDAKGITRIIKGTGNASKKELVWERKVAGVLRDSDIKLIKSYKRKINALNKDIANREAKLADGTYVDRYGFLAKMKADVIAYETAIKKIQKS